MSAEFNLALASQVIGVKALFESTREFCRDYLTDAAPDFTVTVSYEDIAYEQRMGEKEAEVEKIAYVPYPEAYLETLAVYRKIAEELPNYSTLLFQGSALALDGEAYIFAAASGTGKAPTQDSGGSISATGQ